VIMGGCLGCLCHYPSRFHQMIIQYQYCYRGCTRILFTFMSIIMIFACTALAAWELHFKAVQQIKFNHCKLQCWPQRIVSNATTGTPNNSRNVIMVISICCYFVFVHVCVYICNNLCLGLCLFTSLLISWCLVSRLPTTP
jgi:hypothetical protein